MLLNAVGYYNFELWKSINYHQKILEVSIVFIIFVLLSQICLPQIIVSFDMIEVFSYRFVQFIDKLYFCFWIMFVHCEYLFHFEVIFFLKEHLIHFWNQKLNNYFDLHVTLWITYVSRHISRYVSSFSLYHVLFLLTFFCISYDDF